MKEISELLTDMASWNIRLEKEWKRLIEKQAELDSLLDKWTKEVIRVSLEKTGLTDLAVEQKTKPDKSGMELIYKATPITRGRGSLAVKLPMLICNTMGITIDTEVQCYKYNGTLVFKFSKKTPEAQP